MKVYFFATIAAFFAISSAFSSECSIYVRQYDREMQCQGCGDDFYDRYDRRVADALGELGYSVTHDESEKTNFKLKREFTNVDWNKHKISVGIELTENHTARSWKSTGNAKIILFDMGNHAENRAAKRAVLSLPSCESLSP